MSNAEKITETVRFTFTVDGMDSDTFVVVRMQGTEGISQPYAFTLLLLSSAGDLEKKQLLLKKVVLTITDAADNTFRGVLTRFKWTRQVERYTLYEAEFQPRMHLLRNTRSNRVFLDKNVREIAQEVLQASGVLTPRDFEFRLQQDYPTREYVCQYDESDFQFISRWFEHYGIFYFFEQQDAGEKVVFSDSSMVHQAPEGAVPLTYAQHAGLEHGQRHLIVDSFSAKTQLISKEIRVKDYNYRTPDKDISGSATADAHGAGEIYFYGENPQTPSEAGTLAKIRAEELACRKTVYSGRCYTPFVRTGFLMTLQEHYLGALNRQYLVIEAHHQGSQEGYLQSGLEVHLGAGQKAEGYANTFKAIAANVSFRPARQTPKPEVGGNLSAFIDSPGGSMEPHLDDQGRYKVRLPFDLSGRKDGKASSWLRMAQPHVGKNFGVHFPLLKGTEVLLGFVGGNPDRPLICGAVPNPDFPSQINNASETKCRITSVGQNSLYMENKEGNQHIVMRSPTAQSWVRLGAPNDPPSANWGESADGPGSLGIKMCTASGLLWKAGFFNSITLGQSGTYTLVFLSVYLGANSKTILGIKLAATIAHTLVCRIGWGFNFEASKGKIWGDKAEVNGKEQTLIAASNGVTTESNEITALSNKLSAMRNDIEQVKDRLETTRTELNGSVERLQEQKDALTLSNERLEGEVADLTLEQQRLGGQRTELNGASTRLSEQEQELNATKEQLSTEVTRLVERRDIVAGLLRSEQAAVDSRL